MHNEAAVLDSRLHKLGADRGFLVTWDVLVASNEEAVPDCGLHKLGEDRRFGVA